MRCYCSFFVYVDEIVFVYDNDAGFQPPHHVRSVETGKWSGIGNHTLGTNHTDYPIADMIWLLD
jgi:hypothetical protein